MFFQIDRPTAVNLAFCCDAIKVVCDQTIPFKSDAIVSKAYELKRMLNVRV
jgi:hypothetical protein